MDRQIPQSERRRKRLRQVGIIVALSALVVITGTLVGGWLRPTVARSRMRTDTVKRADIEATISANGRVVPSEEQVLTSPIDSRVVHVLHQPGDELSAGDPILVLDEADTQLSLEKLADQIAIKRNARKQAKVELVGRRNDLRGKIEIKSVELRAAEQEVGRNQTLFEKGLITEVALESFKIKAERTRIEHRQFQESSSQAEEEIRVRFEGLDLEIAILEKELVREEKRLDRCRPRPSEDGVLTWVVPRVGTAIRRGDELARVANLRSFRVEATLSDVHAAKLSVGQVTRIRVGEELINGRVTQVRPTVQDGLVTCEVSLEQSGHANLRHNLRVDVHIVTEQKNSALIVQRGSFPIVDGKETVYLVREGEAIRTPVRFGITNFQHYEILEGLEVGDEIILSDMSEHVHMKEIMVR